MKKLFVSFLICILLVIGVSASGTFEYILPTEFAQIQYGTYLNIGRYIKALDKNGKEHLYNFDGKLIIGGYDSIMMYENGMGVGKNGDKYDIINYQGKVLSTHGEGFICLSGNFVFVDFGNNNDGRPLKFYEGNFGVYDYSGNLLKTLAYADYLPPRNASLSFEGGRLVYKENGKYGALNENFEVAIKAEYDYIYQFAADRYSTVAVKDGKYGIIDYDGNILTDFIYAYIEPLWDSKGDFGCYRVMAERYLDQTGIIAADGKTVIFEPSADFSGISLDYSLITVSKPNDREDKDEYPYLYGLVDFNGNEVLPIEHTNIFYVKDGVITAQKSYDHSGYYDLLGREITEFKYRMVAPYYEGLAFAASCIEGVWTNEVLNIDGGVEFYADGFSQYGFNGGVAYIEHGKFINKSGEVVFEFDGKVTSSYAAHFVPEREGIYTVSTDSGLGVLKYTEDVEDPAWYYEYIDVYGKLSKIVLHSGGYELVMKDGTSRYLNFKGKEDNMVRVLGNSVFYEDGKVIIKDTSDKVIKTLNEGEYKSIVQTKNIVAVVYENEVWLIDRAPSDTGTKLIVGEGQTIEEFYITDNYKHYYNCYYKTTDGKYYVWRSLKEYDLVWFLGNEYAAKRDGGWYVVDEDGNERNSQALPEKPEVFEGSPSYYAVGSKILDKNFELVYDVGSFFVQKIIEDKYVLIEDINTGALSLTDMSGNVRIHSENGDLLYLGHDIFRATVGGSLSVVHASGRVFVSGCKYVTNMGDNGYIGISTDFFEGYIDETGRVKLTLPHGYYVQGTFSEGVAPIVKNIIYSRYGETSYIDQNGRIVLESNGDTWYAGGDFKNKIAFVHTNLGKAGPTGHQLIRCLFDTPSDWAAETVLMAIGEGVLAKEQQQRYRKNISREDFCEIVYGLPVVQNAVKDVDISTVTFSDTDNEKVRALSAIGIIFGTGNGKFSPNAVITREEVATILARVYKLIGEIPEGDGFVYADESDISDWARESVYAMRIVGIMQGVGNDKFSPKTLCTTEQTIVAAMRLFQK